METMERWRRFGGRWGPALVIMALIFAASSMSARDLPAFGLWDWLVKKGGHFVGYALLALGYVRGLANRRRATVRERIIAIGLAAVYGITDELHQAFTPGRTPLAMDVVVDACGAGAGAVLSALGERWKPGRDALHL
jgi:hypothetical protein